MNNKLLRISIHYDKASAEPICICMYNNETGNQVEIHASVENVKRSVQKVLESWQVEGQQGLTPEVCEYYAAYADYEARRKAASSGRE